MDDARISELPAATLPLAGTELVPIVQGAATKNIQASLLASELIRLGNIFGVAVAGDSITFGGTYASEWATANPAAVVTVIAANGRVLGVPADLNNGGNSLWGQMANILATGADWLTVFIGANGLGNETNGADYVPKLKAFTDVVRATGMKVAISAPTPYDSRNGAYVTFNARRAELLADLRPNYRNLADAYIPFGEHPTFNTASDPNAGISDGVHLSANGNTAVNETFKAVLDSIAAGATGSIPTGSAWFGSNVTGAATSTNFTRRFVVTGLGPNVDATFTHSGAGTLERGFAGASQGNTGTCRNGDVLTLRVQSSGSLSTAVQAFVTIGGTTQSVTITTAATAPASAVWSTTDFYSGVVVENDNQDMIVSAVTGAASGIRSAIGRSTGKWFGEFEIVSATGLSGVGAARSTMNITSPANRPGVNNLDGCLFVSNVFYDSEDNNAQQSGVTQDGSAFAETATTIGIAVDLDNRQAWFYRNGVLVTRGNLPAGTGGLVLPATGVMHLYGNLTNPGGRIRINGGQRTFANALPSGYSAWGAP